ncbi:MAG TPA: hypothetical protein VM936_12005, partial [Pyrinomonadaceae bacterium]|nr:hypothetical protein [Pyrinomonadaceae bacterium]
IVSRTARTLARRAQQGRPVTRRAAARVMAQQTRRVLGSPRTCHRAIQRNVRATAATARCCGGSGSRTRASRNGHQRPRAGRPGQVRRPAARTLG